MIEEEFLKCKDKYSKYIGAKIELKRLEALKEKFEDIDKCRICFGDESNGFPVFSLGDDGKILFKTYLQALINLKIIKIKSQMDEI